MDQIAVEKDTLRSPCGMGHTGMTTALSIAGTRRRYLQLLLQLDQVLIMAFVGLAKLLARVEVQSSGHPLELLLPL